MTGLGRGHSLLYYEHISALVSLCLWTVSFTSVFLPHPRWDRKVRVDWKWAFPFSYVNGLELTVVVYFSSSKWVQFCSVQSLSGVHLFATPWIAACQASLSITNSQRLWKLMSIESVMPSNHLILCHPLLLPPSIFPRIRVFTNESALWIRWPMYWSFSFNIRLSNEYSELISFRMDWLDLLAVQGTLKSLLQHHSSKASILQHSAFFTVQFTSIRDHRKNHSLD